MYCGAFTKAAIHLEPDGSKWFELVRADTGADVTVEQSYEQARLEEQVKIAHEPSDEELARRLDAEGKKLRKPRKVIVRTTAYVRSPLVVEAVLRRAKGACELCAKAAPFMRRADGSPYLEVHHRVQLANGGEDTVANAVAACPNCHREAHFG
jgi:5-methylcytosine-specific restriction enzyme A